MTSDNNRRVRDIQAAPVGSAPVRQKGSRPLQAILAILAIAAVVFSGVGYFVVGKLGGDMASVSNNALGNQDGIGETSADGAVDVLLVGKDSRTDAQGNTLSEEELSNLHAGVDEGEENTDTIMMVRVPNDGSRATAVSIPRDTYVHDGDYGNTKINAVFAAHKSNKVSELQAENANAQAAGEKPPHSDKDIEQQGVEAGRTGLIGVVRQITGVSIDHYAEVGLLGFVLLTDAVGGVDVCLNNEVDDEMSGAKFPQGQQTLNGAQGLAFVRQRYGLPRNDLDRIVRQQSYMASLVSKVLSNDTLTSPAKLSSIADAVERSVVIDEGWDIMGFVSQLAGLAGGNVTFTTIPVTSIDGMGDNGESIVTIDPNEIHKFMEGLAQSNEETESQAASESPEQEGQPESDPSEKPVAENMNIHVLNAGSVDGLASGIGEWLTRVGYTVERTSNAQAGIYSQSQIVAADANDPAALALAEQMGGLPVSANQGLEPGTYIVVATDDYAGPKDEAAQAAEPPEEPGNAPAGTPGDDFGTAEVAPEIDAGGDGPRCVN